MSIEREAAYAKLNLTLGVLGLREDGFHEMDMVMQSVQLHDVVTVQLRDTPGIGLQLGRADLPTDARNLAHRAASVFLEALGGKSVGVDITIEKHIPVCAGTAGGSSDAAAVLRALNRLLDAPFSLEQLMALGKKIGSDVPYCVLGGTARAQGRGERLTKLPPLPPCYIVLCKPDFDISTPKLFARLDELGGMPPPDTPAMQRALEEASLSAVAAALDNVFEAVLPPREQAVIREIRERCMQQGALGSCMSGTGPTVFALFEKKTQARQCAQQLSGRFPDVFLTKPV